MQKFLFFSIQSLLLAAMASVGIVYAQESDRPARFVAEPAQKMFGEGEEFSVQILLDTKEPVTSWQTILPYDASVLKVKEIQKQEETFPYWFDSTGRDGIVKLMASAPSPGFQGKGLLATVSFEALQAGESSFSFNPSSLALSANDTNLLEQSAKKSSVVSNVTPPSFHGDGPSTLGKLSFVIGGVLLLIIVAGVLFFLLRKKAPGSPTF